jgi:hypothetical protein
LAKYNQLIRIEEQLGTSAKYAGYYGGQGPLITVARIRKPGSDAGLFCCAGAMSFRRRPESKSEYRQGASAGGRLRRMDPGLRRDDIAREAGFAYWNAVSAKLRSFRECSRSAG